jgi:LTXXQ motif family protein
MMTLLSEFPRVQAELKLTPAQKTSLKEIEARIGRFDQELLTTMRELRDQGDPERANAFRKEQFATRRIMLN